MRLWHYKLLPVLPNKFIIAEWRELIAIKRQWEKGTLKHRLVSYVMDYDKGYFLEYTRLILEEFKKRKLKYNQNLYNEIDDFCNPRINNKYSTYKEHNDRYLKQNYYNLQEKYDRGIITEDEWKKICNRVLGDNLIDLLKNLRGGI